MFRSRIIQKITAACMLALFAISITPVVVFHNWLANHTDTCKKAGDSTKQQIGKQTFNCHCDHIVAESPFTEPEIIAASAPPQFFTIPATVDIFSLPASPSIFCSLRGPPSV